MHYRISKLTVLLRWASLQPALALALPPKTARPPLPSRERLGCGISPFGNYGHKTMKHQKQKKRKRKINNRLRTPGSYLSTCIGHQITTTIISGSRHPSPFHTSPCAVHSRSAEVHCAFLPARSREGGLLLRMFIQVVIARLVPRRHHQYSPCLLGSARSLAVLERLPRTLRLDSTGPSSISCYTRRSPSRPRHREPRRKRFSV